MKLKSYNFNQLYQGKFFKLIINLLIKKKKKIENCSLVHPFNGILLIDSSRSFLTFGFNDLNKYVKNI